jgi:D-alanyl-lipoteichoic acid acyltransferase DltB (MBOAT superfamily)
MLFNSTAFIVGFLPVVLLGFFLIGALARPIWAVLWLAVASLFFYAWWRPEFALLMFGSILFNYLVGRRINKVRSLGLLTFGITGNLLLLGWFKYSGFLAGLVDQLTGLGFPIPQVILPLGISFYTFQQIAYLVDARSGDGYEPNLAYYTLFVTFFPHQIAGPIVHHREMLPQFHDPQTFKPRLANLLLGLAAFSIGLFKKVFIADPLGSQALLAYGPASHGVVPMSGDAWFGTLAYALQLYFDFSGYSDMAIGLALMFGIRLPVNFDSPYRAASIIEFWSRWHITLTRFLTAYIYNPIVMSITRRRLAARKPVWRPKHPEAIPFTVQLAIPTIITMTLAGIWHGAGWQFAVFGLFHGVLLAINHGWRVLRRAAGFRRSYGAIGHAVGALVTFAAVVVGTVFFRADSLSHALLVVQSIAGFGGEFHGVVGRFGPDFAAMGPARLLLHYLTTLKGILVISGLVIIWTLPNTAQLIDFLEAEIDQQVEAARRFIRRPLLRLEMLLLLRAHSRFLQGSCIGVLLALALLRVMSVAPTEFLYFTF